jgi:signal transduction histidine kinase
MRLRRLTARVVDGLVVALAAATLAEGAVVSLRDGAVAGFLHPADVVFTVAWTAALLLRRRRVWAPALAPVIIAAQGAALLRWPNGSGLVMLALMLSALLHGTTTAAQRAFVAAPLWPAAVGVLILTTEYGESGFSDLFYPGMFMLVALAAGTVLGRAAAGRRTAGDRAEAAARALADQRAQVAAAERASIAQDLRALVADEIRGIQLRAVRTRRLVADGEVAAAEQALLEIEDAGRETLADLRHMLGLLRRDMTDQPVRPQPGLAALDGIAERGARDGVQLHVTFEGATAPLTPGVEVVVYRVVERITDHARRSGVARVDVTVRRDPAAVAVHVRARGLGRLIDEDRLAVRERVSLYGGDLIVGTDGEDRDVLQVRLPLPASTAEAPA